MHLSADYTRVATETLDVLKQALLALGERFGASIAVQPEPGGIACGVVFPGNQLPSENVQGAALLAEVERTASQHGYAMMVDTQDPSIYHLTPVE